MPVARRYWSTQAYRQALHLRWDRCRPSASSDVPTEHGLVSRAHAIAAAHGRLVDDPRVGLGRAVANACQLDKTTWPALRDHLTQAF